MAVWHSVQTVQHLSTVAVWLCGCGAGFATGKEAAGVSLLLGVFKLGATLVAVLRCVSVVCMLCYAMRAMIRCVHASMHCIEVRVNMFMHKFTFGIIQGCVVRGSESLIR